MAPLDLKVISCCGQRSNAKWRERVAPLSGFIVIEIVQSVKEEGRKEGKDLRNFRLHGGNEGESEKERERERCSWGRVHPS